MNSLLEIICKRLNFRHVIVGFSGGADSTSLLLLLNKHQHEFSYSLEAVHFQHDLRGQESADDEAWCQEFCDRNSIRFRSICLDLADIASRDGSIEDAAREQRLYHWSRLIRTSASPDQTVVALGHHAMDRVENLFIRLFRGSNVTGLTSLRPIQNVKNLTLIRPLLRATKDEICSYLAENGIEAWRNDSSNEADNCARNKLRNNIIPLVFATFPPSRSGILQSLAVLDMDADCLELQAEKAKADSVDDQNRLRTKAFIKLHNALKFRVLRLWLQETVGNDLPLNKNLLSRLLPELETLERTKRIQVNGQVELVMDRVFIAARGRGLENPNGVPNANWSWHRDQKFSCPPTTLVASIVEEKNCDLKNDADGSIAYFDADQLTEKLLIRSWQQGDRLVPFSHRKAVKLKKLFTSKRISNLEKETYPVVCLDDDVKRILWVPFVKRSNMACVSGMTKRILSIVAVRSTQ